MRLGHGVSQHLGGAGVVLEGEQRILAGGAGAPEAIAVVVDQRGDLVAVEVVAVGRGVLQIPEDVLADPGHAVHGHVGQGLVPADALVQLGTQAQGPGGGIGGDGGVLDGGPGQEVGPVEHELTGAELVAVGDGFFLGGAAVAVCIDEAAQLLGDGDHRGGDGLGVEPGHAQDARRDAQLGLGREQGFHAGITAIGDAADDVALQFGCIGAIGHADHDGDRLGLVGDRLQRLGQGALGAGFADSALDVGQQDGGVEWEGVGIGIAAGADHADDGGGNGGDGAGALIDLEDTHAVMVVSHEGLPAQVGR
ncbi:hypothetical protein EHI8A_239660 [Entamoeba histolytica HM-1:IMSS-B]|uniref:Uncharacterized protein n=1 Tax=Entamoeba histolytica HM-1:IMSS-B TaxID=885319 RepID=M3UW84_ENTH1|nr:hypothetical protein EHI8A_239660 [Entamoeba histolytica HM-1:IMSS-B]